MPRQRVPAGMLLVAALLAGCQSVDDTPDPLARNVIDEAGLDSLLLTAGDPEQAVAYFEQASAEEPERADLRRGHAISLRRAGRYPEAFRVYRELDSLGQASAADLLDYGFVAVRLDRWEDAASIDSRLPAGLETARRHLLSALIADQQQDWEAADAAYERAEMLSTNPAGIFNNWGVSKMSRGDFAAADGLFRRALSYDSQLFNAKNNLALVRGLQGNYQLPAIPMTERERAQILHNLGVIATRREERDIARGLFAAAVETHPQFYQEAADKLAALEAKVEN